MTHALLFMMSFQTRPAFRKPLFCPGDPTDLSDPANLLENNRFYEYYKSFPKIFIESKRKPVSLIVYANNRDPSLSY